jgi:O-methyltransferase
MARMPLIRNVADRVFARLGYSRAQEPVLLPSYPDISAEDAQAIRAVEGLTMTSMERRYHLLQAVRHIVKHKIPGSFVECGVWRGGSMMLMAQTLKKCDDESRDLYLYDTFEGMPQPTELDKDFNDRPAAICMQESEQAKDASQIWAIASLEEVKSNMMRASYPRERIRYVIGKVEATIPATIPGRISLLRLDTDWYDSTAHELRHLYPLVSSGGVVIIDDYGYWKGARQAVDEFIASSPDRILLHRIDGTGRAFVKP